MAEAVRKSKLAFLKLVAKLFASVLSLIGVLSGCDTFSADYGVESVGVSVFGHTVSSVDSSYIEGIQVSLSNTDSTMHYDTAVTGEAGYYNLYIDAMYISLPDTLRIVTADIDGAENGLFAAADTLLEIDPDQLEQELQIDVILPGID